MNRRRLLATFAVFISFSVFSYSPAFAQLFAVLLGGNEVSDAGDANIGDPDGSGTATLLIRGTILCSAILVTGIDIPTAAHIHEGAAGVNGPVVVTFTHPPETGDPGDTSECVPADATVLNNISQNPAGFYVNVHTAAYPNGAVRGQLFGSSQPVPASSVRSRSR
jgi:CHRD domain-containing protein